MTTYRDVECAATDRPTNHATLSSFQVVARQMDRFMRNWDRQVALQTRKVALFALVCQKMSRDVIDHIASFWQRID